MLQTFFDKLFSLNHVHFGPTTSLHFVHHYPVLIAFGCILLVVLGYLTYTRQASSPAKRRWMGVVRGLLLAAVFFCVWRPELIVEADQRTRAVTAVWLDSSLSMTLEDPYADPAMRRFVQQVAQTVKPAEGRLRPNRYELAVAALKNAQWLKDMTATQDVMFYSGAIHAQALGLAHNPADVDALIARLEAAKPTGDATNVPAIVQDIIQQLQGQPISALVLLTDGQTNETGARSDAAIAAARRSNVELFTLPVGDKDEPFDLKLTRPEIPENTFVKDPVGVKVHVAAAGITASTPLRVAIYRKVGDKLLESPLATRDITLDPTKKESDVELIFKPEKKDPNEKSERFDLLARVEPQTPGLEELNKANNEKSLQTNVLDAQVNVLYVDGYPRWEFRYLKNELIRESTVNISTLLLSADINFPQEGDHQIKDKDGRENFPVPIALFPDTREDLAKDDVIFIGDVEPTCFSPSQMRLIIDFVKNQGGGIGWIAGRGYNPEAYKNTPLEVLLPVVPDELVPSARLIPEVPNENFNMLLTPAGRQSNLFRFFEDPEENVKEMANLPALYWYKPVVGLKGSAEVLAVHPTKTLAGNPMPLIVTGRYGEGRTMFSGIADTWRWRRFNGEPLFQSYWLQMCRMLYQNKALGQSRRIVLSADSDSVEIGAPFHLAMEVRDPLLTSQVPSQVPIQLNQVRIGADGKKELHPLETIILQRAPSIEGQPERYEGMITPQIIGNMQLAFSPGTLPIDVPAFDLTVMTPQREKDSTTADIDSLQTLAKQTSGQSASLAQIAAFGKAIPDRSIIRSVPDAEEIWCKPIALALVVLLATIEWLIRKSAGLI